MTSQIDLCNRALTAMGSRGATISSFTEGSEEANNCAILFTPTFEALARSAPWDIFKKQAYLSLYKAAKGTSENPDGTTLVTPPSPWLYSYLYPPDCLDMRYLLPPAMDTSSGGSVFPNMGWASSPSIGPSVINMSIAYDMDSQGNPLRVILTNQAQTQAVYTVNQPNPDGWDSKFQQAFVSSLAAWLAPALAGNAAMMATNMKLSEGIIADAKRVDGNEGVTIQDIVPESIAVRGVYWSPGFASGTIYPPMVWPS